MAGQRFDGNDSNGWVLEQGGRFLRTVTIQMASPNVTAASLNIRETIDSTSAYLSATQANYITITNNANDVELEIEIPASVTAALTGTRDSYYYDLEIVEDTDADTTEKVLYGNMPWRREPGGAT